MDNQTEKQYSIKQKRMSKNKSSHNCKYKDINNWSCYGNEQFWNREQDYGLEFYPL